MNITVKTKDDHSNAFSFSSVGAKQNVQNIIIDRSCGCIHFEVVVSVLLCKQL